MIKVLIIDDEPLVRLGMKSIIAWEEHGYRIVGEAGNGLQGLEKIGELCPDIVLIDIMMPQLDGIGVIEEAKKRGFQGKFIILSCVSEIEYLQKAIRLGVSSYILKSAVNPQEILETVEEAAGGGKQKGCHGNEFAEGISRDTEHFAFCEFLNLILKKVIANPQDIGEKMKTFGCREDRNIYLLTGVVREAGVRTRPLLYQLSSIGTSLLEEEYWGGCFVSFEDYLVILISALSGKDVREMDFRLQASAEQYFDVQLQTSVRRVDTGKWNIADCYEEIKGELSASFFEKKEEGELIPSTEYATYGKLSLALEMIRSMMLQNHMITEQEAKKIYLGAIEYVMILFELRGQGEREKELGITELSSWFSGLSSLEQVHKEALRILKKCYDLAERKGFVQYDDELTDTMIQYIHSHLSSKISTRDVAEHVHFSVDYTCKYFKKKTGMNLTDYVLRMKIYRSREDLMQGKSMAEIAEKYGFSSDGHFGKVFKRYEGITPGSFVKQHQTEKEEG